MAKNADAFIMFGMGGAALDPTYGERWIVERFQAVGIKTYGSPYQYYDTQLIANGIMATPATDITIIGGDSLGGNDGPLVCQGLKGHHQINLLFGFQPGQYGEHITVPNNVTEAICIWNSNWFQTMGLGNYEWQLDPDNDGTILDSTDGVHWTTTQKGSTGTTLKRIDRPDFHPGDNDIAMQNFIMAEIARIRA